jgi:hypothetical protein
MIEDAETMITDRYSAAERFVDYLADKVAADATGSEKATLSFDPCGLFWLGRLAPAAEIALSAMGERAERLEPCSMGLRVAPNALMGSTVVFEVETEFAIWAKNGQDWTKSEKIACRQVVQLDLSRGSQIELSDEFQRLLPTGSGLSASLKMEVGEDREGLPELLVSLVNISQPSEQQGHQYARGRFFECSLKIIGLERRDFVLESLPDSFRYDRRVAAWGINCGVAEEDGVLKTTDLPRQEKWRPEFWNAPGHDHQTFSFERLSSDPVACGVVLLSALKAWGASAWDLEAIRAQHDDWSEEMFEEAREEALLFELEIRRIESGIDLLRQNEPLARAFRLMNEAMRISAGDGKGGYRCDGWRPFQLGFLYANLESCLGEGAQIVDIVWFSTGGGKTETYLGIILTAAFWDRFRGKATGITAWSRFPLRLLSLQQTQRFANALAAGEIVRRREKIPGDPFGLGFLVGNGATPNEIKKDAAKSRGPWDYEDESMPERLKMLKVCPFCRSENIRMKFNRRVWRLEHQCTNEACDWDKGQPLPIWIVDQEIWRYLPTVVVGTLDKAAGISMQANMRGMVGAPFGFCSKPEHGHTYAIRSGRPHGCLVPDCSVKPVALPIATDLYGVTFRLQDELHLLRDSLGAVDAHYEALYDQLQIELTGKRPKILASSATLSGYQRQTEVLYGREARVFPHPEPRVGEGFWSRDTEKRMRTYLAVAPRGQTIEFAVDRMMISLQSAIRLLLIDPIAVTTQLGIDPGLADFLVDTYGTDVVYGNTLRDLDAVVRSAETQWGDIPLPEPNVTTLNGRTVFSDVSDVLEALERPDPDFSKRVHVVAASSMMSHGVDIDRLNVMTMLGLPLTTAEFIQATARVGRRWPSVVFVLHKIARERDASVYRAFPQYVAQGDRFVEPIPITAKSRRVLERTMPGLAFARILLLHESRAGRSVAKARALRDYVEATSGFAEDEARAVIDMLGYDDEMATTLAADVSRWYDRFSDNLSDPANANEWSNSLGPDGSPMLSLRDVEEQVEIRGEDPH